MVKRNDVRGRGKKRKKKEKKRRRVTGGKNGVLEKGAKPTVFFVAWGREYSPSVPKTSRTSLPFFFIPPPLPCPLPSAKQEEDASSSSSSSSSFLSFSFLPPFFSRNTNTQRPLTVVSFHIFSPLHSNSFASSFLASLPRFFPLSVFQLQRLQRNYRYLGKDEILVVVVERQLYFSAHTLSLRDPLLDSLFCHEIFTNIQDGGIILPAFRRKSTSHPKRPVPFLPPSPSLSLFLLLCP